MAKHITFLRNEMKASMDGAKGQYEHCGQLAGRGREMPNSAEDFRTSRATSKEKLLT